MNKYSILIVIITIILIVYCPLSLSQDEYSSSVVFTIPWGDQPGHLSTDFQTISYIGDDEIFEPGPWAISDSGLLVIVEETSDSRHIMTFDQFGTLTAFKSIYNSGLIIPKYVAILNTGNIALTGLKVTDKIQLLDSDLDIEHEILLPFQDGIVFRLTTSSNNTFWIPAKVLEIHDNIEYKQYYKTELYLDGSYSEPVLTWDDISATGIPARFISPSGDPFVFPTDINGDVFLETDKYEGIRLNKSRLNQQGTAYELIYTHTVISDPGWDMFDFSDAGGKHFVTWEGDFYTIHATDSGMVLTKYTLQLE